MQDVQKAVRQGRSERRGDAYSFPYVEPLSDVRTTREGFFNILPNPDAGSHTAT